MKVRSITYPSGTKRYQLDLGTVIVDGKRRRLQTYFGTKAAAEAALDEAKKKRREHGDSAIALTDEDRIRFAAAKERLGAVNAKIEDAVDFYLKHARPAKGPIKLDELFKKFAFEKEMQGKRKRYRQQLKCSCMSFIRGSEERPAHTVSRDDVKQWLHGQGWKAKTMAVYLGDLRSFFGWALDEKYVTMNPCLEIETPAGETEEIVTMAVRQAERLLVAAHTSWDIESRHPFADLLGYAAIGLFGGVRPEELQKTPKAMIDLDAGTVVVLGRHAKTRQRRVVDLSGNAVAWLREWFRLCPDQAMIIPPNFRPRWERLRQGCGWELPWPHDIMRHTFASMHYAMHQNEALLQVQLGHINKNTLFKHYRAVKTKKEAAAFWKLIPTSHPPMVSEQQSSYRRRLHRPYRPKPPEVLFPPES